MKKISIITVNLNEADSLQRTIESVEAYAPHDAEYIVIDGASADSSIEVIKRHSSRIATWVSEPDSGIYCAMNKGITRASGEYCLFLNSGDRLVPDNGLGELPERDYDVFYADALFVDGDRRQYIGYPQEIDVNFFITGMINHQNALVRRDLFLRHGLYDESFKICADWLFFLKLAYESDLTFFHLPKTISEFVVGGVSTRPEDEEIKKRETTAGIRQVFKKLTPTILDYLEYRGSVYRNIVDRFGDRKSLGFLLRCYRSFIRLAAKAHKCI